MTTASIAFPGFPPMALRFFAGLRRHNDPVWFRPRKCVSDTQVLAPMRHLVAAVGAGLAETGLPLVGDPERAIFRIYRDVRFSPDKRLYKTHAGAVLTRSGDKRDPGLLYIHLEPGGSMVGAGFWHPAPPLLARLRRAILDDPENFLAVAGLLDAAGYPVASDERLSRPPRGFEAAKGAPVEDYVCWKSFTAHAPLSDGEMQSPELVGRILGFARTAWPLLEWGWAAIDADGPAPLVIRTPMRPLPRPDF